MMKRFTIAVICAFLLLTPTAAAGEVQIEIKAPSAILMHPSGTIIFEKNARQPIPPASVTKIMTMLLVFEAIEQGTVTYEEMVTASRHAIGMGGSQIWLKENEQLSVHEMLKSVAVVSANDCAVALAEHVAGSETAFVGMMNQRAQELGMFDTHFVNACGLDTEGHVTTAYDVALMSIELMKHKKVIEYTTIWMDYVRNGQSVLVNTNKLIKSYNGMVGLKTGFTKANTSGYCLSGVAERDGLMLVSVVMKGATSEERNADVAAMLNYGFANYASVTLSTDMPIMPVKVALGKQSELACRLEDSTPLLIEKAKLKELEKSIVMDESITAPVAEGQRVGTFVVKSGGETVSEVPIVASHGVERMNVFQIWGMLLRGSAMKHMRAV